MCNAIAWSKAKNATFIRIDAKESSCTVGTVRYSSHDYQRDFDVKKYTGLYIDVIRFHKACIRLKDCPCITFKFLRNCTEFRFFVEKHKI